MKKKSHGSKKEERITTLTCYSFSLSLVINQKEPYGFTNGGTNMDFLLIQPDEGGGGNSSWKIGKITE
jgi:hypothetical protein